VTKSLRDALRDLLIASLDAWRVEGRVQSEADDTITVITPDVVLRIETAPSDMPFRWIVSSNDRQQVAASVAGVLRVIRRRLDPDFASVRIKIAPISVAAS
jgi:hypothetical protein